MSVPFSDYIVYIDETGTPALNNIDPTYPILGLVMCIVEKEYYTDVVQPLIKKLKFEFWGHDMAVLHSSEIRKPTQESPFLFKKEARLAFLDRLDSVLASVDIKLIAQIVHKEKLLQKYPQPYDPYNIALRLGLEQLHLFLLSRNQDGKLTHLIVESRGKKEDKDLELEFRRIQNPMHNWGLAGRYDLSKTPFELKFAEKKINSAGLQLADLAGQPIGRHFLHPDRKNWAFETVKQKILGEIWQFP